MKRAPATLLLLISIVIGFVFQVASSAVHYMNTQDAGAGEAVLLALLHTDVERLIAEGAITPRTDAQPWRFFTAPFLHSGLIHLLLNAWALLQLGALFERISGSFALLLTYGLSALGASIASALFLTVDCSVGASGAIFGVAGALIATQRGDVAWSASLRIQLVLWSIFTIILGVLSQGVDNAAHAGGFATGLAVGFVLRFIPAPRRSASRS